MRGRPPAGIQSDIPLNARDKGPAYIMGKKEKDVPLYKGKSKNVQEKNFHELKESHPDMDNKQRVAIVLNQARKSGAHIAKSHRHKEHR